MYKKTPTEDFTTKCNIIHNNYYDYSKTIYTGIYDNVCIICPEHGEFWQTPNGHKNKKAGCPKCAFVDASNRYRKSKEQWISEFKEVHGNKFDYSKMEEPKNGKERITIICTKHNLEFKQAPIKHKAGQECQKCRQEKSSKNRTIPLREIKQRIKDIHSGRISIVNSSYTDTKSYAEFKCNEIIDHPNWKTTVNHIIHAGKTGCPHCKASKNEKIVSDYLTLHGIPFTPEYKFADCKNKQKLPFDFYLPELNIAIEVDGEQHFQPSSFFGGMDEFLKLQKRDVIKYKYCRDNNIQLIRIPYYANIIRILNHYL